MKHETKTGTSHPLGATLSDGGTNFSLFSRSATRVELVFFDRADAASPTRSIELDPHLHRTYHYWHAFVPGVKAGQLYGYRVHGPSVPERGMRFDPTKVLLDPYGRGVVVPPKYSRQIAAQPGDNCASAMKSVVTDPSVYDWEGDAPLRHLSTRTIIYEMHVRGFTIGHPEVPPQLRGTYAALATAPVIDHLKRLGITAVELMPVHAFIDDRHLLEKGLRNYWGYNSIGFFAPDPRYLAVGSISE